jgi:hypothetical protein
LRPTFQDVTIVATSTSLLCDEYSVRSLVTNFLLWPEDFRRTILSPRRQLVALHVSVISTSVCPVHQKRESQLKFAVEEIVLLHLVQELQPGLQQTHQQLIQVWRLQENQLQQWRKGWR